MLSRAARFLILLVLAVAAPERASAHAVLLHAAPTDGVRLASPPERIELHFNEPVHLHGLRLAGTGGITAVLSPESGAADRVVAPLPPLRPGNYVVSWRLASADGHPVTGSLAFSIGQAAATPGDPVSSPGAGPLEGLHPVARAVGFAAGLTAAGALLFLALIASTPVVDAAAVRRFALAVAAVAVVAVFASAIIGRAILDGEGPIPAATALLSGWAGSGPDPATGLRLAGLALVALGAAMPRATAPAGIAGAVAVAASFGLTGHAAAHGASRGQPWLPALLAAHVLCVAFWIGSLWPLLHAARTADGAAVRPLMARFSAVALAAVPVLAATGITVAAILVGGWHALVATAYGRWLGAKVLLVAAMLALAALNRWRLVPALGTDDGALGRLRRSIGSEIALAVAVFAATAAMTSVHPPSARAPEMTVTASAGRFDLALSVSPGLPGPNAVELRVAEQDGTPVDPLGVTLRLSNPGLGIEEIVRPMDRTGPGTFRHDGPEPAIAGTWLATVDLLVDDFERRRVEFPVLLGVETHHAH